MSRDVAFGGKRITVMRVLEPLIMLVSKRTILAGLRFKAVPNMMVRNEAFAAPMHPQVVVVTSP